MAVQPCDIRKTAGRFPTNVRGNVNGYSSIVQVVRERPTASDAISVRGQNAAAASQAQSVAHRKLHVRS
jgi:hypothetical protein